MGSILSIIIGYLLGSLSSAIISSKLLKFPDPRKTGSGNAGATNVLRGAGLNAASMVMVGDIVKGLVAILIARILGVSGAALSIVALATVIGHIFPVFFKFKGGKGVATMCGTLIGLSFFIGLLCIAVWVGVIYLTRYASLASIVSAACATIFTFLFGNIQFSFAILIISALIIWKHKDNIARLKDGSETKVNFK